MRCSTRSGRGDNFEKLPLRGGEGSENPHPNGGKAFENLRPAGGPKVLRTDNKGSPTRVLCPWADTTRGGQSAMGPGDFPGWTHQETGFAVTAVAESPFVVDLVVETALLSVESHRLGRLRIPERRGGTTTASVLHPCGLSERPHPTIFDGRRIFMRLSRSCQRSPNQHSFTHFFTHNPWSGLKCQPSQRLRVSPMRTQNPPPLKACRFDSDLGHH
jgi:hypothetical protein